MYIKSLLAAAALAVCEVAPAYAVPIELDFSFGNVSGTFYGLDDTIGSLQNFSTFDLSNQRGTWTGVDASSVVINEFYIQGNTVFQADFVINDVIYSDNGGVEAIFDLRMNVGIGRISTVFGANEGFVDFTIRPANAAPTVPLPAGGLLLLSGLVGLAAARRRTKRIA